MKIIEAEKIEGCKCKEATVKEAMKHKEALLKTMTKHYGLAAPQVGIFKRFFVMKNQRGLPPWLVVNPEMKIQSPKTGEFTEMCLSYPGKMYRVRRYKQILASWINEDGKRTFVKLTGKEAQVFQHELDHLNGVTIKLKALE